MNHKIPRILITTGEPAGIGPDIIAQIAERSFPAELIVVGDPDLLETRAKHLKKPLSLTPYHFKEPPKIHTPGTLTILPVELKVPAIPGTLNPANAPYVMACLELATEYCLEKMADALVTGPVHKAILNQAGFPFIGHTEFLAEFCEVEEVIMLFVVGEIKVALATTHIPLAKVPSAISKAHLNKIIRLLQRELKQRFKLVSPRILVAGLNPHAGEAGLLGHEEIDSIIPALLALRADNIEVLGPFPADTLFTKKRLAEGDVILGMYHDQVLPVIKHIGFDRAVNVTLGLPIIRTSVDHGTALDIAGTAAANPGSLTAAISLALKLASMIS